MRLITTNQPIEVGEIGSQTDLLTHVTALFERLFRHYQTSGLTKNNRDQLRKLANDVVAAAQAADESLASQRERIALLERLATTDELTGLMNRRGFSAALAQTLAQARRFGESGLLAYIDLDGFKPINDEFGHAAGDAVLRHVADLLRENSRGSDVIGRLGGDEFGLVLVRSTWDSGLKRIRVLDRLLNNAQLSWGSQMISIRASIGVQAYNSTHDAENLLSQADAAMYQTKRNRLATLDTEPVQIGAQQ